MDSARKSQRLRLENGTEQVAAGRVFAGVAFISNPEVVEFRDFEVGKVYETRVQLTNVSYSFNSFKVRRFLLWNKPSNDDGRFNHSQTISTAH